MRQESFNWGQQLLKVYPDGRKEVITLSEAELTEMRLRDERDFDFETMEPKSTRALRERAKPRSQES